MLPWRAAVRGEVFAGRLPLWNPYVLGGSPLLAVQQPAVLHPGTWVGFLLPLAQAEILGRKTSFLEGLFAGRLPKPGHKAVGDQLMAAVLGGGYPEAIARTSERRRQDWIRSYMTSVLTRDLRDIAEIERLTELPKFAR